VKVKDRIFVGIGKRYGDYIDRTAPCGMCEPSGLVVGISNVDEVLLLVELLNPGIEKRTNLVRAAAVALQGFSSQRIAARDYMPVRNQVILSSLLPDKSRGIREVRVVEVEGERSCNERKLVDLRCHVIPTPSLALQEAW
jgi:hypothetical protein